MIRDAIPADAGVLTDIALRAKAHWGYDDAFMAACRDELTVTAARLAAETTRVHEAGGAADGFYSLSSSSGEANVELFFVDPPAIGRGVGAALWRDLVAQAALDAVILRIESDPQAEGFYRRMGAVRTGTAPSGSIPGRELPLLIYDLRRGLQ